MKFNRSAAAFFAFLTLLALCSCGAPNKEQTQTSYTTGAPETSALPEESGKSDPVSGSPTKTEEETMIYARVNGAVLEIKPENNSSAEAFIALLEDGDLTVDMHDYGGFEKVGSIGVSLPRNDESITTVPGDVILYQGNQITIYYGVNTWSFTRIGRVRGMDKDALKNLLGSGGTEVVFSLERE